MSLPFTPRGMGMGVERESLAVQLQVPCRGFQWSVSLTSYRLALAVSGATDEGESLAVQLQVPCRGFQWSVSLPARDLLWQTEARSQTSPQRRIEPTTLHQAGQRALNTTNELFRSPSVFQNQEDRRICTRIDLCNFQDQSL